MVKEHKISNIDYTFSYSMMKDSDILLFEKIRKSDQSAFETLFMEYYERLCHYANAMLNNLANAEDEVQQMFTKLWDKRSEIHIETTVKSYLYQAVKNGCLNKLKQQTVHRQHRENYQMQQSINSTSNSTHQTVLTNEVIDLLYEAIESMPHQCKLVFEMSRMEGLKHQEIADKLGLNVKTIENHIGRALKIVKLHLQDYLSIAFIAHLLFQFN